MKKVLTTAMLLSAYPCFAQNYIDNYLSGTPTYTTIANSSNSIAQPRDLDFKPHTHELWVANKGSSNGGSIVLVYDAGAPSQTSELRMDTHTGHFMVYPTAIAFSNNGNWGNTNEIKNTASPASTFMGPALWTGDTSIFAKVFQNNWVGAKPLGSHLDMLHQSPFAMGIAADTANCFWVNDGYNNNLCYYDFQGDHSPGYDDHSNGKIWRYSDITLTRLPDVPSHMVLDHASGWLYIVDAGTKRLIRVNTNTGTVAGTLTVPGSGAEALQGYWEVTGATEETIETFGVNEQPCGVDVYNGRMIVSDFASGDIHVYDVTGTNPVSLGTIATGQAGITGVKIGADGKIWFVNYTANTVVRIDPSTTPNNDAGIYKIISPEMNTFPGEFYNTGNNVCAPTAAATVELKNTGANALTSVNILYQLDGGTPGTYAWTGNLAAGASVNVTLPAVTTAAGTHVLSVRTADPNGNVDSNPANDQSVASFRTMDVASSLPFSEEFTATTFPPAGWTYVAHNFNSEMSHTAAVGGFGTGMGAVKMNNYDGNTDITGQRDILMTPRLDFSTATSNVHLGFHLAYAQYDGTTNDSLTVLSSTDCGETWNIVWGASGAGLSTANPTTGPFTPTAANWANIVLPLGSLAGQPDVIIAFRTASGFGNNLYIDNINITNNLSVQETVVSQFSVYPNPTTGMLNINMDADGEAMIVVRDITGRVVASRTATVVNGTMQLNIAEQANGAYFVDVTVNGQSHKEKIVLIK